MSRLAHVSRYRSRYTCLVTYNNRNRYNSAGFAKPSATAPASDAQYSFIAGLLRSLPTDVTGVTDVDAAITALRDQGMTKAQASAMIDQLKTMSPPAAAAGAPAARTNRYPGRCAKCGGHVEAGAGLLDGKKPVHLDGKCLTPESSTAPSADSIAVGLYLHDSGHITKVYITQNDNKATKALVGRSFQYVKGGLRVLRECLLAKTVHMLTETEAREFGKLHGFCVNCAKDLDDDRSLAVGYGPVCAARYGWFYPTYAQAGEILGRPCAPNSTKAQADGDVDDKVVL